MLTPDMLGNSLMILSVFLSTMPFQLVGFLGKFLKRKIVSTVLWKDYRLQELVVLFTTSWQELGPMMESWSKEMSIQFMPHIHSPKRTGSLCKPTTTEITPTLCMTPAESQWRTDSRTEGTRVSLNRLYWKSSCSCGRPST